MAGILLATIGNINGNFFGSCSPSTSCNPIWRSDPLARDDEFNGRWAWSPRSLPAPVAAVPVTPHENGASLACCLAKTQVPNGATGRHL
jgi:hypothetical protein